MLDAVSRLDAMASCGHMTDVFGPEGYEGSCTSLEGFRQDGLHVVLDCLGALSDRVELDSWYCGRFELTLHVKMNVKIVTIFIREYEGVLSCRALTDSTSDMEEILGLFASCLPFSYSATNKQQVIGDILSNVARQGNLVSSMAQPLRLRRNYESMGRRTFLTQQLPEGALPVFDEEDE